MQIPTGKSVPGTNPFIVQIFSSGNYYVRVKRLSIIVNTLHIRYTIRKLHCISKVNENTFLLFNSSEVNTERVNFYLIPIFC